MVLISHQGGTSVPVVGVSPHYSHDSSRLYSCKIFIFIFLGAIQL